MLFCTKLEKSCYHTTACALKCVSLKILRRKCDTSMRIALKVIATGSATKFHIVDLYNALHKVKRPVVIWIL